MYTYLIAAGGLPPSRLSTNFELRTHVLPYPTVEFKMAVFTIPA